MSAKKTARYTKNIGNTIKVSKLHQNRTAPNYDLKQFNTNIHKFKTIREYYSSDLKGKIS